MKGVILAAGYGMRLRPMTEVTNKHLLPVYNKPMILFPLETLKKLGIKDILIITGGEHLGDFMDFLEDGSDYSVNLTYKIQKKAGGIAQALSLAKDFVGENEFAVILGDNIFENIPEHTKNKCQLVVKPVKNPNRFGVYHDGKIIEKPENPKSDLAVTGLYFYTPEIFPFIETLVPSARGELEITDVNNWCLANLNAEVVLCEGFWSDAGTFDSLLESSQWVKENLKK